MSKFKNEESALLTQKHQQDSAQRKIIELGAGVDSLIGLQVENRDIYEALDSQLDELLSSHELNFDPSLTPLSDEVLILLQGAEVEANEKFQGIDSLDFIEMSEDASWEEYLHSVHEYAYRNGIDLTRDPFSQLMSESQQIALHKRIDEEFTFKNANCDKYDYMIAGTCGMMGGLIDVVFIGAPGNQGFLNQAADKSIDASVRSFAKLVGWNGGREGSDPTKSAIGFLERKYKVNYDHRHSADVGGSFKMSASNHHIKSLAHSPDLVGLFFSILSQFTSTAHFVDGGQLITIDTETYELKGSNFVSKVFCGFVNWFGHLLSDAAGSSGASGRGSGIPIPFYSLLQFINIGSFGQHRDTFAKVAVKVFEGGYDFRHGLAMAIPVTITELLTRFSWTIKQRFYHEQPWGKCIPSGSNPELRRMLLVGHGTLCLVDGADAALRSGGNIVGFLLRTNIIGWTRFSFLAVKELNAWYNKGKLDFEAANEYLDSEYEKLLKRG